MGETLLIGRAPLFSAASHTQKVWWPVINRWAGTTMQPVVTAVKAATLLVQR